MGQDKKEAKTTPEEAGWQYKPADDEAPMASGASQEPEAPAAKHKSVSWSASEFVAHEKGAGWYAGLTIITLIIVAGLYFMTRDVFSTGMVLLMAVIFGVASSHKPKVVEYKLDDRGLTVGSKFYPYTDFKSFSMPQEGPFVAITLMPMKHLSFPVGAYLAPDNQDKALDLLSQHLPLEKGQMDRVERLMHSLRF